MITFEDKFGQNQQNSGQGGFSPGRGVFDTLVSAEEEFRAARDGFAERNERKAQMDEAERRQGNKNAGAVIGGFGALASAIGGPVGLAIGGVLGAIGTIIASL